MAFTIKYPHIMKPITYNAAVKVSGFSSFLFIFSSFFLNSVDRVLFYLIPFSY
jgi:hypothetical protein